MEKHKKVLFCTDLSEACDPAFNYALDLVAREGGELDILHVLPYQANHGMAESYLSETKSRKLKDAFRQELRSICSDRYGVKIAGRVPFSMVTLSGSPEEEIIKYAEKKGSDLIVMGGEAGRRLSRVFNGRLTDRVAKHSKVTVVIVPTR